jgi:hypothetical protein
MLSCVTLSWLLSRSLADSRSPCQWSPVWYLRCQFVEMAWSDENLDVGLGAIHRYAARHLPWPIQPCNMLPFAALSESPSPIPSEFQICTSTILPMPRLLSLMPSMFKYRTFRALARPVSVWYSTRKTNSITSTNQTTPAGWHLSENIPAPVHVHYKPQLYQ